MQRTAGGFNARTQLGTSLSSQEAKRLAISCSVAQLGAMKNLAAQAFSQHFVLGRIFPEYADGTLMILDYRSVNLPMYFFASNAMRTAANLEP
jgi:hypothetical protein